MPPSCPAPRLTLHLLPLLPLVLPLLLPPALAAPSQLPGGAKLDWEKVVESRYGVQDKAKDAPAAPAAPAASITSATPAAPAAMQARERVAGAAATVWLEPQGAAPAGAEVPVTFGQVFGPGAVPRNQRLEGRLADGTRVPLQVDVKARHADGSLRHAVVSAMLPPKALALGLVKTASPAPSAPAGASPADALRAGLRARFVATLDGKPYSASLEQLLARGEPAVWLEGPVAYEWQVAAPLADDAGQPHPHLAVRFALRWYPSVRRARVDVAVENNWAYEPAPQNFVYDAELRVGGDTVYARRGLEHYHHARWRKLSWWGGPAPALQVRHDSAQLIDSLALPNYDRSLRIDERALADMHARWTGPKTEPMGVGQAARAMPTTGGRPDIGLLPGWAVMYLLGMDARAREITLGTADLAGSWSMHYRDRRTGLPVSLIDYPYMTTAGTPNDTFNRATGKQEYFPRCARPGACRTPNQHDVAHQPSLAYLPYLLTGDHYYLEELQFWAMFDVFYSNPGYRKQRKGLLAPNQVRGQAWGLRTLAEAAYITPDAHPLKKDFLEILDSNLDWYNASYTSNPEANKLGILTHSYAVTYRKKTGIAPWQDDFFTSAVGHVAELGFDKARPLLAWKAAYPVARMIGEGSCWVGASMYSMVVRATPSSPFFTDIGQAYRASLGPEVAQLPCGGAEMAAALKLAPGEMSGYAGSPAGFPANLQPALAYAVDALGEDGRKAWRQFMARSVKPDYGKGPQFAILPRRP